MNKPPATTTDKAMSKFPPDVMQAIIRHHEKMNESVIGWFLVPVDNLKRHPRQRIPSPQQVQLLKGRMRSAGEPDQNHFLTILLAEDCPEPELSKDNQIRVLLKLRGLVLMGGHRLQALTEYFNESGIMEPEDRVFQVKVLSRRKWYFSFFLQTPS
jgi:hypothetical protein